MVTNATTMRSKAPHLDVLNEIKLRLNPLAKRLALLSCVGEYLVVALLESGSIQTIFL